MSPILLLQKYVKLNVDAKVRSWYDYQIVVTIDYTNCSLISDYISLFRRVHPRLTKISMLRKDEYYIFKKGFKKNRSWPNPILFTGGIITSLRHLVFMSLQVGDIWGYSCHCKWATHGIHFIKSVRYMIFISSKVGDI